MISKSLVSRTLLPVAFRVSRTLLTSEESRWVSFKGLFAHKKVSFDFFDRGGSHLSATTTHFNILQHTCNTLRYAAKETYNFKEPTIRSHPISVCLSVLSVCIRVCMYSSVFECACMFVRMCACVCVYIHTHSLNLEQGVLKKRG